MSIISKDFLSVAENSLKMDDEAGYRSCISRSYYGLFHATLDMLRHCPDTTHAGLIDYLLVGRDRKGEPYKLMDLIKVGAVLKQQKTKRKIADYDLNMDVPEMEARLSLRVSADLVEYIHKMKCSVL